MMGAEASVLGQGGTMNLLEPTWSTRFWHGFIHLSTFPRQPFTFVSVFSVHDYLADQEVHVKLMASFNTTRCLLRGQRLAQLVQKRETSERTINNYI